MLDTVNSRPIRVIIVDDVRSIRAFIKSILLRSSSIEVVGEANDPYEARELIRELNPDVITLDVEMPRMDGLSFLERLMRLRPIPVVMVSSRTTENSAAAIQALSLGACDCIDIATLSSQKSRADLLDLVVAAARSRPRGDARRMAPAQHSKQKKLRWNGKSVLIGSSTGGVDALTTVLSQYPEDGPPTVIAQHMPPAFLESFTSRLNGLVAPTVRLAKDGDTLRQGDVLVAPGGHTHIALTGDSNPRVTLVPNDGTEPYVPSINVLFASARRHAKRTVAVMLTGMGRDGADPMLALKTAGAYTIAQDGASAVVDGMPKAAREIGAASEVTPLNRIAASVLAQVTRSDQGAPT